MSAVILTVDLLHSFHTPEAAPEPGTPAPPPEAIGAAITLPDVPATPPRDLLTVLRNRRSVRFFGAAPTPAGPLRAAVEAGLDADARRWSGEHACCPLTPVLVAQYVDGLPPAAYRFDGTLAVPVMELAGPEVYPTLTLQREFAGAGAILSVLGDLDHAERAHGGAGYRMLMTRAGAAAYRMWLAAIAHDLVGSVFAGFLPAAVRAPLRCDGTSRHQLFALALGLPGEPQMSAGPADRAA